MSAGLPEAEGVQKWRLSLTIVTLLFIGSGAMFAVAASQSTPAADFRTKGGEVPAEDAEGGDGHTAGGEGASQGGATDPHLPLLGHGVRSLDDAGST